MSHTAVALKAPPLQGKSQLAAALKKVAANVWRALEQSGQRRGERELARFATQYAHVFPELAHFAPNARKATPTLNQGA
jgi:hypothetical protein